MKTKELIAEIIAAALILLFVYTAVSKAADYEVFRMQLMQSPLLAGLAQPASIGLPLVEAGAVVLLLIRKTRLPGLFLSLSLMTMFTTYIIVMLNYSRVLPCSCGGILSALSWQQHLAVNVFFMFACIAGIMLLYPSIPAGGNAIAGTNSLVHTGDAENL